MFESYIIEVAREHNLKVISDKDELIFVEAFKRWKNGKIFNNRGVVLRGIGAINNSIYIDLGLFERIAPNTFKIL